MSACNGRKGMNASLNVLQKIVLDTCRKDEATMQEDTLLRIANGVRKNRFEYEDEFYRADTRGLRELDLRTFTAVLQFFEVDPKITRNEAKMLSLRYLPQDVVEREREIA